VSVSRPTAAEAAVLKQVGWRPGQAVPSNMASLLQKTSADAQHEISDLDHTPLPVPPDTPPVTIPPETSIDALPPDKQAEIRAYLAEAESQMQQMRGPKMKPSAPGIEEAIRVANQQMPVMRHVVDDRQDPTYADTNVPKSQPIPPPEPQTMTEPAPAGPTHCPHCAWDLSVIDPVIPTNRDKQVFLQATLGNIPFERAYELLGGKLQITVRSLRPEEIDACYKQAYLWRAQQETVNDRTFWEQLNRYRLCLQLVDVRSPDMVHEFPKTMQEWGTVPDNIPNGPTLLHYIHEEVYKTVLRTETLVRLAGAVTAQFNRLVSKLEANAANPDFWEATPSDT
jgi:hypothetical protein